MTLTRLPLLMLGTCCWLACGGPDPTEDPPMDPVPDAGILTGQDGDADGLDDGFEASAGSTAILDPTKADTDGDGTPDGMEDPDGDGLTNAQEQGANLRASIPAGSYCHPLRVDLLVELDAMAGLNVPESVLAVAAGAFAALPTAGVAGNTGVGLHFYWDETTISAVDFDGSGGQRTGFLHDHGPLFNAPAAFPKAELVHVAIVRKNNARPTLPAESVFGGDVESAGVLVYYNAIDDAHPACNGEIQLEDALAAAIIHELGHTLQLGHDTDVGGGVNIFNIMALATNCAEAIERFHGRGNNDPTLGNTEAINASRFSHAAAALMRFNNKLSVDTASLVDDDGVEM